MAGLSVAAKKREGVCEGEREKGGWSKFCGWWISESRWEGIKESF